MSHKKPTTLAADQGRGGGQMELTTNHPDIIPQLPQSVQTSPASLALTEGFTPVFDEIAQAHGTINALVFGAIWRNCQKWRHVCDASHQTMANDLGLSRPTVHKAIRYLVNAKLIIDHTPDQNHKPHTYTTNIVITWQIGASAGVNEPTPRPPKNSTSGPGGVNDVTPGVNDVTPRCKRRDTKKQDKRQSKQQHQQPVVVAVDLQKEFDRLNAHLDDPIYANNRTGGLPLETTQQWAAHAEAGGDLPSTRTLICMIEREQGPPANGTNPKEVWKADEEFTLYES